MTEDQVKEIIGRIRRIETRVTTVCQAVGAPTPGKHPHMKGFAIIAPSKHVTLSELLGVLRESGMTSAPVFVGEERMGILQL